jgi:hypothetical protein
MADKQIPGVGGAPLPPEDQYKPSFLEEQTGIRFAGSNPFRSQTQADIHARARYETIKVWSDYQGKLVSAGEYLRETEPVAERVLEKTVSEAVDVEQKVLRKQMVRKGGLGIADPEAAARDYVINQTVGKVPLAGKLLGRAASKIAGLDVTTMGDATIDGTRRRASDAIRQEYDQLAIHWKRSEVQNAVHGRSYEPNFLMGIANVRRVTDGMQDFTARNTDSTFVHRQSMDQSEAGDIYREPPKPGSPLWMADGKGGSLGGGSSAELDKEYKKRTNFGVGKVTMNYDAKKAPTPIA